MGYPCLLLQPPSSPVADHPPSSGPQRGLRLPDKRGFLQKLAEFLHPGPDSKDELIETLA
ncbi:MAG TPA: magnesium/cobalt efflux protein, partial [Hydrogenophaga sp.]|nr:magnesium/cobalt efflux protein [Hydrogenophaga sp.]